MSDEERKLIIEEALKATTAPWQEAFNLAMIPGMLKQQSQLHLNGERAQAQVDAYMRAKFKSCGMEDAYRPPGEPNEGEEDEMGDSYSINSPVINITEQKSGALSKPWWKWLLGILAAVALAAGIVFITAAFFNQDPSAFDMIAVPFDPNS
jgi:hypothetical protein